MSLESSSSQWLANSLSALLASPYVHFPQPPVVGGIPINLGPGPLDLFSTRFENLFTQDATGVVAGKQVDKDGLKEILLAVQQHWNPGNARFVDNPEQDGIEPALTLDWCPQTCDKHYRLAAEASTSQEGGMQRIQSLKLEGDDTIFHL